MIFIALGSQKFQFNRLLRAVDKLIIAGKITDEVYAQIGYSDYKPQHYEYKQFMDKNEFVQMMEKSEIIISHGGTGVIINAIKMGKKVLAVPRLKKYGEHVDDHQTQLTRQFADLNLICECRDCEKLAEILTCVTQTMFTRYQSNTQVIINSIDEFIQELE